MRFSAACSLSEQAFLKTQLIPKIRYLAGALVTENFPVGTNRIKAMFAMI
jgi:hypothetical protein